MKKYKKVNNNLYKNFKVFINVLENKMNQNKIMFYKNSNTKKNRKRKKKVEFFQMFSEEYLKGKPIKIKIRLKDVYLIMIVWILSNNQIK